MAIESRAKLALFALACISLGSMFTYGMDRLNSTKPVIISDAVNVPPDPSEIKPSPAISAASDDAPAVIPASTAAPKSRREKMPRSSRRGGKHKITSGVIHLNSASLEQLEEIPGVGPGTAQDILDFRNQSGGFQSIDELGDVPRMGAKKLAKIMPFVSL